MSLLGAHGMTGVALDQWIYVGKGLRYRQLLGFCLVTEHNTTHFERQRDREIERERERT